MPRIPQAAFNLTPSTRVETARVSMPEDNIGNVIKQTAGITNAMAQLQDQTERTDAHAYANEVKNRHNQRKVQYAAALESVNGSGMTDYIDPTDPEMDMAKKRRIQRPIQEMYKEMVDSYEQDKQKGRGLQRSDISEELMREYVGDDLIQMQMSTNKHLNRVRTNETKNRVNENMELHLSNYVNQTTQPDATPEMINMYAAKMRNSIAREISTVAPIIGREGTEQFRKLSDRAMATAASQIVSTGVTNSTAAAADALINRISDPGQRQAAFIRVENTKKQTATVKNMTLLNSNKDIIANITSAAAIDDMTYAKGMENVRNTFNMYTDPKYSIVTPEQKNASAVELASGLLSKRLIQQNIGVDMTYLNTPADRSPSGAAASSSMDQLRANIDEEIKASGILGMLGNDATIASSVRDMTIQKMRTQQAAVGDNLAEMVKATNPGLVGRAFVEQVQQAADAQAAGDVPLVGKKERSAFKQNFERDLVQNPSSALDLFNQQLANAGAAYEGETSYRRRIAIDLADKDVKLAYLLPMADADQATQYQMVQNASRYQSLLKEIPQISDNTFQEAFAGVELRSGLQPLRDSNPMMYEGVKQMIFHEAARSVRSKGDVQQAVRNASKSIGSMYTSIPVVDGTSSVLALSRPGGIDYASKSRELSKGASTAVTLPMLSREEKIDILQRYGKAGVLDTNSKDGRVTTPDSAIDFHLKNLVTIQPDGTYPNMHVYKIGNSPISKKDGTRIKVSAEQLLQYGEAVEKRTNDAQMKSREITIDFSSKL